MNIIVGCTLIFGSAALGMYLDLVKGIKPPSLYWVLGSFSALLGTTIVLYPYLIK